MTGINEIVFVDDDGFDFNDGEKLIRFDNVTYYSDTNEIVYAVTNDGRITINSFYVFEDNNGEYIEYGNTKIYIPED